MKIAIIGTHSTGKTTLIKLLHCELQLLGINSYILPELARLCPFPINEETTLEAQTWIQSEQIKQEQILEKEYPVLICDRSTIDNFAYMHMANKGLNIGVYEQSAAKHMGGYAAVFKTQKLEIKAQEDTIRSTEETFRSNIDKRIKYFLYKHDVPHVVLDATIDYKKHIEKILRHVFYSQKNRTKQIIHAK